MKSIFLLLIILLTISAINGEGTDKNESNINLENNLTHIITEDTYSSYFDDEGNIKEDSGINDGDILKIGNLSDKIFIIDRGMILALFL